MIGFPVHGTGATFELKDGHLRQTDVSRRVFDVLWSSELGPNERVRAFMEAARQAEQAFVDESVRWEDLIEAVRAASSESPSPPIPE